MQEFCAPILSANKKGKALFVSMITAGLLILIFTGIFTWLLQLIGMLIFIYGALRYYLQTKKQVLKKKTGKIIISETQITVPNGSVDINSLISIVISVSGWQHYARSGDRNTPLDFHSGDNNILSFLVNGEEKKFEIELASRKQWELLREHVISWYRRGIKVIENNHETRTYGLESLNYSQIQEFKKIIATPNSDQK